MAGEVGLSGEIRPISRIEQRIKEAEKLGFNKIIIPEYNFKQLTRKETTIEIVNAKRIEDAFRNLFG